MRRILEILITDRPAIIAATGTAWTVVLDHVHTILGILVGLVTLVYLSIKIRQELKRK